MPPDCAVELRASKGPPIVGLLTESVHGVCNILKIEDFSQLNHLISVLTQGMKFCSTLKS